MVLKFSRPEGGKSEVASALWVTGLVGRRPLNAGGSTFLGTLNSQQAGRRGILMTTGRMDAEGRLRLMPQQIVVYLAVTGKSVYATVPWWIKWHR